LERLINAGLVPHHKAAETVFGTGSNVKVTRQLRRSLKKMIGDRVTMTNVTLRTLIQVAYPGMSEIVGGPGWVGSGPSGDRFDVNAKAETPASRNRSRVR
jgi:uncharacterized protein (TIGR03435 family)